MKKSRWLIAFLDEPGIIPNWLEKIAISNLCQPPAVVVRRSVYERLGSFYGGHYGEDWEMWCRIAANFPVAYSPRSLAEYRSHPNNITTRSHLTGQSITDIDKFIKIIRSYLPSDKRQAISKHARKNFSKHFAVIAAKNFYGDRKKYLFMAYKSFMMDPNKTSTYFLTRIVLSYLVHTKEPSK